jgi:hypothetical protein
MAKKYGVHTGLIPVTTGEKDRIIIEAKMKKQKSWMERGLYVSWASWDRWRKSTKRLSSHCWLEYGRRKARCFSKR